MINGKNIQDLKSKLQKTEDAEAVEKTIFERFLRGKGYGLFYHNKEVNEFIIVPKGNDSDSYASRKKIYNFKPQLPEVFDLNAQRIHYNNGETIFTHKSLVYKGISAKMIFIPNEEIFNHLHKKKVTSYSSINTGELDKINFKTRKRQGIAYE